jgi:DNA-binding transcriptional LysR family regulator
LPLPRERVTSGTLHLQKHLLATGRFLTITSSSVLQYNAEQWAVKALPIDLMIKPRPHAILRLKNRTLSPVVQLFIDELKAVAGTAHKPVRKAATRSA